MRSYTIPRKAASFLQASASYSRRPFLISSLIISAFITLSQVIICKAGATPRGSYSPSLRRSRPPPARSLNRLKRDRPTNRRKEGPLRREKVPLLSGQSVAEAPSTPSRHPPETASQPELTTMQRGTAFTQAEQTPGTVATSPRTKQSAEANPATRDYCATPPPTTKMSQRAETETTSTCRNPQPTANRAHPTTAASQSAAETILTPKQCPRRRSEPGPTKAQQELSGESKQPTPLLA